MNGERRTIESVVQEAERAANASAVDRGMPRLAWQMLNDRDRRACMLTALRAVKYEERPLEVHGGCLWVPQGNEGTR